MNNSLFGYIKNNKNTSASSINDSTKTINVKGNRCPQNHPCPSVRVCPVGALTQQGFKAPVVNHDTCIMCGKCLKFCPMKAIVLE